MTSQAKLNEFRDVLREILGGALGLEEQVLAIVNAAQIAFDDSPAARKGVQQAMMEGMNRCETIKTRLAERFKLNYVWKSKSNQEILEWLMGRPEVETVDIFADWWWSDDWRRTKKGAPSLTEIYTYWPQAFSTPEFTQAKRPAIFHAGDDHA